MSIESTYLCNLKSSGDNVDPQDGHPTFLAQRINHFNESHEDFLDILVPCSVELPPSSSAQTHATEVRPFAHLQPTSGHEAEYFSEVISGLSKLVTSFANRTLEFVDARKIEFTFPFSPFASKHHTTTSDIAVSFPGRELDAASLRHSTWEKISLLIDVKREAGDDPFESSGTDSSHERALVRLTRNTRNLMLAHGHLAAFSLGFYGENVRIARFDHSCVTVCKSFNVKKRPDLLQRFLWHFVNPVVGDTVVGCDPTVRRLTREDKIWVKQCLTILAHPSPLDPALDENMRHGRRVLVLDERTGSHTWYIAYHPISINATLFSRATTVWRAFEDARSGINDEVPRVCVLKDSWRMLARPSEVSFYQRLQSKIPAGELHGLAKLECGADLGQLDVREWELSSPNASCITGQRDLRLSPDIRLPQPASSSKSTSTSPTSSTSKSITATTDPHVAQSSSTGSSNFLSASLHDIYPLPLPQHQTFSWTMTHGTDFVSRERSHMRFVVSDVGRPITRFKNTRELVRAVRDAIIGHRQAFTLAGVLHRDVSVGNILIVDKPQDGALTGFLHDFDYSKIVEDVASLDKPAHGPRWPKISDMTPEEYDAYFKWAYAAAQQDRPTERAGTFEFMAIDILRGSADARTHKPLHDLESFYWVLLWVVLRHTSNTLGIERCREIFEFKHDEDAAARKLGWLAHDDLQGKRHLFYAYHNVPLSNLMRQFRFLVQQNALSKAGLDYDDVLEIFDAALSKENWPEDDWVPCPSSSEARSEDSRVHCACAPRRRNASPALSSSQPPVENPAPPSKQGPCNNMAPRTHAAQTSRGTKRSRAEAESDDRGELAIQVSVGEESSKGIPRHSTRRSGSANSESKRRRTVLSRQAPSTHPMILRDRRARRPPKYRSQ